MGVCGGCMIVLNGVGGVMEGWSSYGISGMWGLYRGVESCFGSGVYIDFMKYFDFKMCYITKRSSSFVCTF